MKKAGQQYLWMAFLWTSAIYVWSVFALWARSPQLCTSTTTAKEICRVPGAEVLVESRLLPLLLLTLLVLGHGLLLWLALTERVPQRYAWSYLALQALLILLMGAAVGILDVAQPIYLALTLGAVGMLTQARATLIAVSLLYLLKGVASMVTAESLAAFLLSLHDNYVTPLFLFVIGYLVLYVQQIQLYAKLRESHSALAEANAQLAASTQQVTNLTRQNERQRLAREWHDTLAQSLLGLIRQLDVAQAHLASQRVERAHEIVTETANNARTTLAAARNVIVDLRTNVPTPETLPMILREEIDHFTEATGIPCEADLSVLARIPPAYCEHAQRTISEGLNNIARHAHAHHVWIEAIQEGERLRLLLRDDGVGLPNPGQIGKYHYGLLGLRERARMAHGHLEVRSQPGEGTTLCLSLPIEAKEVL